ncbi:MAG TPA: penicillin-binding protein 2 [Pelagibacteraceae bacterium]|jgi:cell division protein FtsI (penicillin-binding protein 3)|nr:penicillin-binding protein 2 [Pelagibacteraceae bacterium]
MHNKKGENNNSGNHIPWGSRGFFFEDYETPKYEYKQQSRFSEVKLSLNRVSFIFFIFLVVAFVFGSKIIYLASVKKENYFTNKLVPSVFLKRQDIFDRNNNLLARNVKLYSAAIKPQFIIDKGKLLINLRMIFPNMDIDRIKKKIEIGKYFYIKRRLNESEWKKLWLLGDKSIDLNGKQFRVYPHESLFSHVLGQIDDDNVGISGLEKSFNKRLTESKNPLILSLDSNLQHIIREELVSGNNIFQTLGSAALLMEINSGEILSLVSLPDFDLNKRNNIEDPIYLNKITKGVYELGSVFKTFTLAAGLESESIKANTVFKDLKNQIICGGMPISEHDELPKNLTAEEILVRSSNIGAIRIAQKIGVKSYKEFLNSLELFEKINFDLEEVGTPLPFKWEKCTLETASFGHGITTTLLQLAKAYAIIGNGGYKINPTILLEKSISLRNEEQIISLETSNIINSMLRKVVSNKKGTASFADKKGYEVGGKTGTARKAINGIYSKEKKINTFVSLFPINKPKYVLLVMLDEPKSAPDFVYKFSSGYKLTGETRNTAGWNTVIVAGNIIEKIGPILATNNLQASNKL